MRKNAVRLAESFLVRDAGIQQAVLHCVDDADAAVQLQVAYALGAWHDRRSADALGRLALRHADDPYLLTGVLSSLGPENINQVLEQILSNPRANASSRSQGVL